MDSQNPGRHADAQNKALPPLITRFLFDVFRRALGNIRQGNIRVILPNGYSKTFGSSRLDRTVTVHIASAMTLWRSLYRGSIGFAESYMLGEWETDDLAGLFRLFLRNSDILRGGKGVFRQSLFDKLFHRFRKNTRSGSKKNISQHYDLGNAFYSAWLDKSMTYSSALFEEGISNLNLAQIAKFRKIIDELNLTKEHTLLEIGCGWGSFARYVAEETGAVVTGITLSTEQLSYANSLKRECKLENCCEFRLQDYRDVGGLYDRIASIEMIEAVGRENWNQYFSVLHDRLTANGTAIVQAITINENWYADYCRRPDFIQRYIFPGGFLPTSRMILEHASQAGFSVETVLNFGDSYAMTLWQWKKQFKNAWPQIRQLGFDYKFRRMWEYYLTYCATGFEIGTIDVGLYRLRKMPLK